MSKHHPSFWRKNMDQAKGKQGKKKEALF